MSLKASRQSVADAKEGATQFRKHQHAHSQQHDSSASTHRMLLPHTETDPTQVERRYPNRIHLKPVLIYFSHSLDL